MINQLYLFFFGLYQSFAKFQEPLLNALITTTKTVGIATVVVLVVGTLLAGLMRLLSLQNNFVSKFLFSTLNKIVNILGACPAIVFIIAIMPITRLIVGYSIGIYATIISISAVGIFFQAARFYRVLANEDQSSKDAIHDTVIYLLSASAIADVLGGGGLCDFMVNYGYNRFEMDAIILVSLIYVPVIIIAKLFAAMIYGLFFRKTIEKPTFHRETIRKYGTWIQN